ncbi:hypothetical protein APY94_05345 [Thermococcus celericrescens]|uniref:Uncharacterized protein n=1 Tax=Thermococcus celericrescens TaxID=227598 RepID=A0A100XY85_9EURY|nr:hypothetical protein APY94_05345 [Thermococcus celericrescens]
MGVDNYVYLVFDMKLGDVRRFLEEEFKLESWDDDGEDTWVLDLKRYSLLDEEFQRVASGELAFDPPLRTTEGERIINADFRIYSVKGYTILEIHPAWRSRWGYVLSSELIRLLKKFMRAEPLLICGYRDDADLTELGFKHNNQLILINWLPKVVKTGRLEVIPSALTVVKRELLKMDTGLYGVSIPWRPGERGFLFIGELNDYAVIWFLGIVDLDDPENVLESLYEPSELACDLVIPVVLPLRDLGLVEDKRWQKIAENAFKTQISGTYNNPQL